MAKKDKFETLEKKMRGKIGDPLPNFPDTSISSIESDLNSEYLSLRAGYNTAKAARIKAYNEYKMSLYGNEVKGQSDMVDSTIFNIVEWMVPTMIQPFMETQELVDVTPEGADVRTLISAAVNRELLAYQLKRKIPLYQLLYDTIKAFLIQSESYAKLTWKKKKPGKNEPVGRPEPTPVPAAEIRYDWTVQNFLDSTVVTQDQDLTRSDLIEMMTGAKGLLEDKFMKIMEAPGRQDRSSDLRDEQQAQNNWVGEKTSRPRAMALYKRREHWTMYDVEATGKAIPIMAVFIDDVLVQVIKNPTPLQRPPFYQAQCIRDVLGNPAFSWAEVLSSIQKFRTGIMRMLSDNLNAQNNGIYEVDRTNIDDVGLLLLQKAPAGTRTPIPVRKPGSINPLPPAPIANHAFTAWEMMEVAAENRSGFTRYSQGSDSRSLNQTATGISAILQRSDMRMWEQSMRFVEMFLKPMVRGMIAYNQTHLDKQQLKVQFGIPGLPEAGIAPIEPGEWITLSKEDIGGYFNVDIDIKISADNQQRIDNLLQFAQFFGPLVGQGVTQETISVVSTETAKAMGLAKVEAVNRSNYVGTRGITIPASLLAEPGGDIQEPLAGLGGEGQGLPPAEGEPGVQGAGIEELLAGLAGGAGAPVGAGGEPGLEGGGIPGL